MTSQYRAVFEDIKIGFLSWRMWGRIGWQENKRRYRRTVLGPFWTTLSMGIFILAMGTMWSQLWKQDPKIYLPFLASGMVVWGLVGTLINEGCTVFVSSESLIKSIPINYTMLACAAVWRNCVVLAHNMMIFIGVSVYGGVSVNWHTLLAIPGLMIIALNGVWVCLLLGLLCARFRDIQQVVGSTLQVAMLVTPIFWSTEQLGRRFMAFVDYNALYHFVDVVRAPLLGKTASPWTYEFVAIFTVIGWTVTIMAFSRFRSRIPYWL